MGSDVTVASTTDTQDEVNQAAGGVPQDEAQPELKPPPTGDQQVESGEPETPPEPEKKAEEQPAPKNLSKRFDKLYREKKELEERLAAIEERQNGQPEPQKEAPVVPTEVAAKFDTFDSWSEKQLSAGKAASLDDFLEARDAWKEARDEQKAERQAIAEAEREIELNYAEKVSAFKAEHEDWDEVIGESEISIPTVVGNAIKQFENGPEVVYYLAKNPKEAQRVDGLPPVLAVAEIGRISARLEKAASEEQPTNGSKAGPDRAPIISKAPPPIKPLGGNALRNIKSSAETEDFQEYKRRRAIEEKAARGY